MISATSLLALIRAVQSEIDEDYRAPGFDVDDEPSIQLTLACNDNATDWGYQTGDNSFTGGAYSFPHWGVATVTADDDAYDIATVLLDQLDELVSDRGHVEIARVLSDLGSAPSPRSSKR